MSDMSERLTVEGVAWFNEAVKFLVPLCLVAVLTSCTTLENRRDLYSPQKVWGPYTRMLKNGIPKTTTEETVTVTTMTPASDYKNVVR